MLAHKSSEFSQITPLDYEQDTIQWNKQTSVEELALVIAQILAVKKVEGT